MFLGKLYKMTALQRFTAWQARAKSTKLFMTYFEFMEVVNGSGWANHTYTRNYQDIVANAKYQGIGRFRGVDISIVEVLRKDQPIPDPRKKTVFDYEDLMRQRNRFW